MYSGPVTIIETKNYRVDSYGRGAAYAVRRLDDNASVFFQGDDAAQLREELDKANDKWTYDHILSEYDHVMDVEE